MVSCRTGNRVLLMSTIISASFLRLFSVRCICFRDGEGENKAEEEQGEEAEEEREAETRAEEGAKVDAKREAGLNSPSANCLTST